jgi:hypothetical protein
VTVEPDFEDSIEQPDLLWMFRYWAGRAPGSGLLPGRQHIDPVDFPSFLPRIALIEVLREGGAESPSGFRYRLTGTEIVDRAGRDPTGKRFDDLYAGDYLVQALETYRAIVEARRPNYSRRTFPLIEGREHLEYTRLILPLAGDGTLVDMLCLVTADLERVNEDDLPPLPLPTDKEQTRRLLKKGRPAP